MRCGQTDYKEGLRKAVHENLQGIGLDAGTFIQVSWPALNMKQCKVCGRDSDQDICSLCEADEGRTWLPDHRGRGIRRLVKVG